MTIVNNNSERGIDMNEDQLEGNNTVRKTAEVYGAEQNHHVHSVQHDEYYWPRPQIRAN